MEIVRKYPAMILAGVILLFCASGCAVVSIGFERDSGLIKKVDLSEAEEARAEAFSKYAWGLALELEGEVAREKYEKYYVSALEALPESRILFQRIVRIWLEDEDYERIIEVVVPLARKNPEVPHLQIFASTVLQAQDRLSEALELLENAYYKTSPRSLELLREYVAVLWRKERYTEISQLLRRAASRPELKATFGLEYIMAAHYEGLSQEPAGTDFSERRLNRFRMRARKHAQNAAELFKQEASFYELSFLFEILKDAEIWEAADELLARGREFFPERELELLFQEAISLRLRGEEEAALAKLSDLENILPMEFAYYTRLGREFLELEAEQKAHFYLSRAYQQRRDVLYVRVLLAYVKLLTGRHQEAYRMLEAVEDPVPHVNLLRSQAALELGRPEEARDLAQKTWEQAKEAEDDAFFTLDFYLYQAVIFDKLSDLARTLELAELALEIAPESAKAQNFLGYILADHDLELERAEKLISRAIESEPESVAIRDSLAWVYYRQGRYEEALREINRTLYLAGKRGVEDEVIYDHAGDIYAANSYRRLAVYYWRRAILRESDEKERLEKKIQELLNQP